jgi:hypothetical protein
MPSYKCPTCGTKLTALTQTSLHELIAIHVRAHQTRQIAPKQAQAGGGEAKMQNQSTGRGGTATARPQKTGRWLAPALVEASGLPQLVLRQYRPHTIGR